MFVPRPTSPVSFDEIPTSSHDIDGAYGSDDGLDEFEMVAKRRRIEKLAQSYLQGKPVFILSASLRGPLEDSWENPWRKRKGEQTVPTSDSRRIHNGGQDDKIIPKTEAKKQGNNRRVVHVSSSIHPNHLYVEQSHGMTRKRKPAGLKIAESPKEDDNIITCNQFSTGQERYGPQSGAKPAAVATSRAKITLNDGDMTQNKWLKRDKHTANMIDTRRLISPTPAKRSRPNLKEDASVTDLELRMDVPRSKLAFITTAKEHLEDAEHSDPTLHQKSDTVSHQVILKYDARDEGNYLEPSGRSSCPSKVTSMSQRDRFDPRSMQESDMVDLPSARILVNDSQLSRSATNEALADGSNPHKTHKADSGHRAVVLHSEMKNTSSQKPVVVSHPDHLLLDNFVLPANEHQRASSTSILALKKSTEHVCESSGLENIPSAQPIPENIMISEWFTSRLTSLHSTNPRIGPYEHAQEDYGERLTTQTAILPAAQPLQLDSTTGKIRDSQQLHIVETGTAYPLKGITPFYKINATTGNDQEKIFHQEKLDAFTPVEAGCELLINPLTRTNAQTPTWATTKKSTDQPLRRATFPTSLSEPQTLQKVPLSSLGEMKSTSNEESEARYGGSVDKNLVPRTSFSALPLTLSAATPSTELHDGQGFNLIAESFDVNQVIKDVGSWLQSGDFEKQLKMRSGKSGGTSSTQTYRPTMSLES